MTLKAQRPWRHADLKPPAKTHGVEKYYHTLTQMWRVGALCNEIGLYDPNSGERLPVLVEGQTSLWSIAGMVIKHGKVPLGEVVSVKIESVMTHDLTSSWS